MKYLHVRNFDGLISEWKIIKSHIILSNGIQFMQLHSGEKFIRMFWYGCRGSRPMLSFKIKHLQYALNYCKAERQNFIRLKNYTLS